MICRGCNRAIRDDEPISGNFYAPGAWHTPCADADHYSRVAFSRGETLVKIARLIGDTGIGPALVARVEALLARTASPSARKYLAHLRETGNEDLITCGSRSEPT